MSSPNHPDPAYQVKRIRRNRSPVAAIRKRTDHSFSPFGFFAGSPSAARCFGPLLIAASTACSNRSQPSGRVSNFAGFDCEVAMVDTVMPAFIDCPDEAASISRILAGYGELEFLLCRALGKPLGRGRHQSPV